MQPRSCQMVIDFSDTTLTIASYGDVLPASPWAHVLANIEMGVGVLYIAVLFGRLVGLYSQRQESAK